MIALIIAAVGVPAGMIAAGIWMLRRDGRIGRTGILATGRIVGRRVKPKTLDYWKDMLEVEYLVDDKPIRTF